MKVTALSKRKPPGSGMVSDRGSMDVGNLYFCSCGILPFEFGIRDHHPILIEVNSMGPIGKNPIKIVNSNVRRLQGCISKVREKCNPPCEKMWIHQGLLQKLQKFYGSCDQPILKEIKSYMMSVDFQIEKGLKYAEKRCSKLRMVEVYFRPTLNKIGKTW